jgi:hypothetical protein
MPAAAINTRTRHALALILDKWQDAAARWCALCTHRGSYRRRVTLLVPIAAAVTDRLRLW